METETMNGLLVLGSLVTAAAALVLAALTGWLAWETRGLRKQSTETAQQSVEVMKNQQRLDAYPAVMIDYAMIYPGEQVLPAELMNRRGGPAHRDFRGLMIKSVGRGPAIVEAIQVPGRPVGVALECRQLPPQTGLYLPCKGLDRLLLEGHKAKQDGLDCYIDYHDLLGYHYRQRFVLKLSSKQVVPQAVDVLDAPDGPDQ